MGSLGVRFGQQVRTLRRQRGWSQGQLAEAAGASEEWIRRIERGARSPSFDTLEALSMALGVSVARLFQERESSAPRESLLDSTFSLSDADVQWVEQVVRLIISRPSPGNRDSAEEKGKSLLSEDGKVN